jgi:hypothetical protein
MKQIIRLSWQELLVLGLITAVLALTAWKIVRLEQRVFDLQVVLCYQTEQIRSLQIVTLPCMQAQKDSSANTPSKWKHFYLLPEPEEVK